MENNQEIMKDEKFKEALRLQTIESGENPTDVFKAGHGLLKDAAKEYDENGSFIERTIKATKDNLVSLFRKVEENNKKTFELSKEHKKILEDEEKNAA